MIFGGAGISDESMAKNFGETRARCLGVVVHMDSMLGRQKPIVDVRPVFVTR